MIRVRCSRCKKRFGSKDAAQHHIDAVHKGVGEVEAIPKREDDESEADRHINRILDHGLD